MVQVLVKFGKIEDALRNLKRMMQKEGSFKEMKNRKHYEKPSVKKLRKREEAQRRRNKIRRRFV